MALAVQTEKSVSATSRRGAPRLGFLGLGWIGRNRLEALLRHENVEVVGLADTSREASSAARELAPGARVTESLEELLSLKPDGVVIATPSGMHARQAIEALEGGVAVFCQKPLGRSAKEVGEIIDTARLRDRLLGLDMSYRHLAAVGEMRRQLAAGEIGEPYAVEAVFHNAYGPDKPWFYDPAKSGGGCVMDLGIHLVDLALWLTGQKEVQCGTSRLWSGGRVLANRYMQVEDHASVRMETPGGLSVDLRCSWNLHCGCDAIIELTIFGGGGALHLHNVGGSFFDFALELRHGTQGRTLVEPPDDWSGRALCAWTRQLAESPTYAPDIEDALAVAKAIDQIYQNGG